MDFVKLFNYKCIAASGDTDDNILNKYSSNDSAVACAFHLSLTPSVRAIPLSLFGKDIETGFVDYDEAIRQAEIYACVAEKSKKMNRKAADEYKQFFKLAHQCLLLSSDSPELSDEQKLFLYWYCIDGLSESAQTHMNILEINNCLSACDEIITIAAYAKPIALISDGISERLGDTIADVAGVYCRNNRLQDGIRCYDEAIDIHNRLADKNGSDYHRARALWITVSKQLLIFSATGNLSVLTKAEADANSLLSKDHIHPAICCIAQGALGLINMQKGAANEILGLKSSLERYIKKASRRFF